MANDNPYMTEPPRRRGAHFAQPVAPDPVSSEPVRKKKRGWFRKLLTLLLFVALVGGGVFAWKTFGSKLGLGNPIEAITERLGLGEKKVAITVNGEEVKVAEGSSVQAVFEAVSPAVEAGNLLSVGGNVLGAGEGDPYAATLDGTAVAPADAAATTVAEGAVLTFDNGADKTEEYTSETTVTSQPKMVRKVKEGTHDAGYMVQQGVVQYVYQWGRAGSKEVRTGTLSGETVDGTVTEGQDCIIMCQDITPDNGEKLVALTFDDGPTNYTQQYMDILNSYGIKATFNLIGEQVEDCAGVVQANCAAGNQITSHTWHHPDLTTITEEETATQLGDTFDVIKRVADYDTSSIRAPYGDIDINVWLRSKGIMSLAIYWTHDSEDWKLPGVDTIVANCTVNMAPGSVILLHDGGGDREQDLEALPRIIEAWQDAGYKFVTIEELMASDSSIPAECCANYRPMPEDAVWPTELAATTESSDGDAPTTVG